MLLAAGLALAFWQAHVRHSYSQLARSSTQPHNVIQPVASDDTTSPVSPLAAIDWKPLLAQNADTVAWVRVEGTDIDLPVVCAQRKEADYYLNHDFWQRWALEGTPFLDHRSCADGPHRLVYGHHLATGGQFSSLQKAHQPDVFAALGPCYWLTPTVGTTVLQPLLAERVESDYAPIQRFDLVSQDELSSWLRGLARDASARSGAWEQLCHDARSVVTLVTCSSDFSGQKWRTLVVFVQCS